MRADQSSVFGGMVIPSGFTYTITYEPLEDNAYGGQAEISDVRLSNGETIDPDAWYTVATTDYELGKRRLGRVYGVTTGQAGSAA